MGGLFGGGNDYADAAREQARQTEIASKRQEAASRQQAANAQAQQENLIAREKVQEQIRTATNTPTETATVDLTTPASTDTTDPAALEKKRNPRQTFLSKASSGGSGIKI